MQTSDFKLYRSKTISDSNGNGGRESRNEITSNKMQDLFPALTSEELAAGGSRLRKIFPHLWEDGLNARFFIKIPSNAEDFYVLIEGDHTDTQGDLTGNEKQHATGKLASQANAGAMQIVVNFDDANEVDLEDGDRLWIAKVQYNSETGYWDVLGQMFNTVAVSGVSWNGNQATIILTEQLNIDYPAESICAMVLDCGDAGDLKPKISDWTENSSQGTYDEVTYPLELDHKGTVRDDFTLTINQDLGGGVMGFSVSGLYEGNIGSGRTDQDFAPVNPETSTPYLTLPAAGWGGTWAINDTIGWKTYPCSQGVFAKEIWPAGANSNPDNKAEFRFYAE